MPSHSFIVNGKRVHVECEGDVRLLWVLRDLLGIHGPKYGCGLRVCRACTSFINGKAFNPCSVPVSKIKHDDEITTIEGLAATVKKPLHPMQQAWIDHDVAQCGYCQPGQIMNAVALVEEIRAAGPLGHRGRPGPDPQHLPLRDLRPDPRRDPRRRGRHARGQAEGVQAKPKPAPEQEARARAHRWSLTTNSASKDFTWSSSSSGSRPTAAASVSRLKSSVPAA